MFQGSTIIILYLGNADSDPAIALEKAGVSKDDVDCFEINEAFASQCLWCIRELGLDERKVR